MSDTVRQKWVQLFYAFSTPEDDRTSRQAQLAATAVFLFVDEGLPLMNMDDDERADFCYLQSLRGGTQ